ncbi:MAG: hypothetical protein ACYDCW_07525 [Acidithiobacillus ferrivorans]
MRYYIFYFVLFICPFPASATTPCFPLKHPPKNFSFAQSPQVVCRFNGPAGLVGWLTKTGDSEKIYFSTGPMADVLFAGPVYGRDGKPQSPHLVIEALQ